MSFALEEISVKLELTKEIKLPTAILAADATPDGRQVFAACLDRGVYTVDVETGACERIGEHESYASGVVFFPRAGRLISAGYDGALQWYDPNSRQLVRRVQAHRFWSWRLAASPNEKLAASVTGQYLSGGYKYEPAPEQEPCVKVFDAASGELRHGFSHLPPVLSVAFSPDSQYLAAGNMMGEVRVWNVVTGELAAAWTTPDFTSWGIIKSHHYIGGIFSLNFAPGGNEILACGMGSMRDPMAGNGKQLWQRFAWREKPPRKSGEISESDQGSGLQETLDFHPAHPIFVMAGRLAQGQWNTALFGAEGKLLHSLDAKMRVTAARFSANGEKLFLAGAVGQERKKGGVSPAFGRLKIYDCVV